MKPAVPYSIFQEVSVPPAVQEISAEADPMFEAVSALGLGHVARLFTAILSIPNLHSSVQL